MATRPNTTPAEPDGSYWYLFNCEQSSELESYRLAMRGLADLATDLQRDEPDAELAIRRINLWAIFDQMEKRLADIIGPEKVKYGRVPDASIRDAVA